MPSQPNRNAYAGVHRFKPNGGKAFNTFEVHYIGRANRKNPGIQAGWYWRPLPIDGMPAPEDSGPFTSSRAAYRRPARPRSNRLLSHGRKRGRI